MLNIHNYKTLKERYFYAILIVIITAGVITTVIRLSTGHYAIALGDFLMLVLTLLVVYLYEKSLDFQAAVLRVFWLNGIILFILIFLLKFNTVVLLVILLPLLASVLLDAKTYKLHASVYMSIFIAIMVYGFLHKENYIHLQDTNFVVSSIILFIFVMIHSTMYNKLMVESYNKLEIANRQKEYLLKEIHHRVKNNLNIVASMLGLEKYNNNSQEIKNFIAKNKLRIESIALVHELLYSNEDLKNINFEVYVQRLSRLILNLESDSESVEVLITCQEAYFEIHTMMQFGIILNELITNSVKHAFEDNSGVITISLQEKHGVYEFHYKDNGKGYEESENGFGLELIAMSTKQLDGYLNIYNKDGFNCKIIFKV